MLRAIHRKTAAAPDDYVTTWPFRTYHRADASPIEKGLATDYVISLLPVAWTLTEGSKLRLSISGADAGHFVPMPHGRPPNFTIHLSVAASSIEIPVRLSEASTSLTGIGE